MPEITEAELKKQITRAEFARLYFLDGEEKYLVEYYAKKLMAKAGGGAFPDFNLQKFDGEADTDQIGAAVEALPFLSERKCVAVSDLNENSIRSGGEKKWIDLLAEIPETTVLLIYQPTLSVDERKNRGWKKFVTGLSKIGNTVRLNHRSEAQLEKLLCSGASRRGCELSRSNAAQIVRSCGSDLNTLLNELDKMCAFVRQGEISADVIDRLAVKNLEARVFDLSKAILSGAYDRAYEILDALLSQNEEPVSILAVLSGAYLDLYRVKVSLESGFTAREPAKHFDYARKEFRLTNAERTCRRFSSEMLRASLQALLSADIALKSARGDRRIVLEKLIAQLLLIAEGGKMD